MFNPLPTCTLALVLALPLGAATTALALTTTPAETPPSREDTQLTRRLQAAGESLGVPLADHIIVGQETYHSFRAAEGWDWSV